MERKTNFFLIMVGISIHTGWHNFKSLVSLILILRSPLFGVVTIVCNYDAYNKSYALRKEESQIVWEAVDSNQPLAPVVITVTEH